MLWLAIAYLVLALYVSGAWLICASADLPRFLRTHDTWLLERRGKLMTAAGVAVVVAGPLLAICGVSGQAAVLVGIGALAGSIGWIIWNMTPPKP